MTQQTDRTDGAARHLGTRTLPDGTEADVLAIAQTYDGDVADVWDAVTNPDRIVRWFAPVSGELKVGGRYEITGNASGEVLTCEPPNAYGLTWEYGGDVSWVEVELTPAGDGRTRFELRHIAKPSEHWKTFGPGAVGIGWDLALMGLEKHLGPGADVALDPAEAEAWGASEEGKAFMTASGEGWYEADVARGTDPAEARGRADRTIAFYRGEGEGVPAS